MIDLPESSAAVRPAVAAFSDVVVALPADALRAPTPCEDFDVAALLGHLCHWLPRLRAAASGSELAESWAVPTGADPRERVLTEASRLAAVLAEPGAWVGTRMFEQQELPARMIGAMALCEFVLHGWDLAVAAGLDYRGEPVAVDAVAGALRVLGPQGRANRVFGPEVAVEVGAPPLARVLGLAGRDPAVADV
ncbi:TIGR03086 family protein [Saccharomonospora piscinae]|uniref:TIGR03086 family protein n=1 Tax=Saccharomonospora piscinae TaxID=687388 RepID=A0A1V9A6S7_SACPI|nr:TIGR03086 family metal-binding protein [Saccharomonospora piscinae]OQO92829.1 TIGR03086 family protein [Saccharomonospora piscinae]TLW92965.1 TIGR03086 family protein [Saccharomonospora piscinae]